MARRRKGKKSSRAARRRNFPNIEKVKPKEIDPNVMYKVLNKPLTVRVLSIDPGNNMGICMSVLDFNTQTQTVLFVNTFDIDKEKRRYENDAVALGSNAVNRTHTIKNLVKGILDEYQADVVICEAAFLGRFPQAFASLVLCLNALETAVYSYDSDVGFYTFDPPTVKVAMEVDGKSKDKNLMHRALLSNTRIKSELDLTTLDEHSVDSICVGHCYFKLIAEF